MEPAQRSDPRFVVLGASNVARGLAHVVHRARGAANGRADVLIAAGHGRSFGLRSCVWCLARPGIGDCALWAQLRREQPTRALVTDVGNDLLYGANVPTILRWVERCVTRLADAGADIVVTGLPLERTRELGRREFVLWTRALFPRCRLDYATALVAVDELESGLREIAGTHAARFVPTERGWYGLDPVHYRRSRRADAWDSILDSWQPQGGEPERRGLRRRLRFARAHDATWFGLPWRRPQPAIELRDGTSISLF